MADSSVREHRAPLDLEHLERVRETHLAEGLLSELWSARVESLIVEVRRLYAVRDELLKSLEEALKP